jgi:sialate O-acetylesterase
LPATYKSNLRKPGGEEKPLVKPSPTSQLQGFAVCGADRTWVWADAKIDGSVVVVWSDKVPAPVAVRYAWADHPVCNLYGKAGLPAFTFRTDDFPGTESAKKK